MFDCINKYVVVLYYFIGICSPTVLPNAGDICASFQYSVLNHIAKRLQRALLFCEMKELLPMDNKTLVRKHFYIEVVWA